MLTLAICTYNRAASLRRALGTLTAQRDVEWSRIEVIVVDNNCTDDTAAVVASFARDLPIRRVVETAQGLSHARNRVLEEALGEWIIFTDDDVVLEPNWLSAYCDGLAEFQDAGFAAGRVLPDWQGDQPSWFLGEMLSFFDGLLVWCDKGTENRRLAANEAGLVGASFAINPKRFRRPQKFRTDLGHNGKAIGCGEETEFVLRLQADGIAGAYIGRSYCKHIVDFNRLTFKGLYKHGLVSARAIRMIGAADAHGSWAGAASFLVRGVYQLLKGRGDRFRQCVIQVGMQIGLRENRGAR